MRRLAGWIIFLLSLLMALSAVAESVVFGDTVYVYPDDAPATPTFTLAVRGTLLDPETLELVEGPPLSGATFGVYARSGGEYIPFPDPADPTKPLTLTSTDAPLSVVLPLSIDLYIRQESVPEGYTAGTTGGAYLPLFLPGEMTFINPHEDTQGVRVTVRGIGAAGMVPLSGMGLLLDGVGSIQTVTTDADGVAQVAGLLPGTYTLTLLDAPDGYRALEQMATIMVEPHAVAEASFVLCQDGRLLLRPLGMALDGEQTPRLIPIGRRYEVFAPDGMSLGVLGLGESMTLPTLPEGTRYTLRALEPPADGYEADTQVREVWLYPGQEIECQPIVRSEKGFFAVTHLSTLDSVLVPGGSFALLDDQGETVLSFEADAEGRYLSATPLPAGDYSLVMTYAAENHQYDGRVVPVHIEPYFAEGFPVTGVVYESQPIPTLLLSPEVVAAAQPCASLFEVGAEIDFTLVLAPGTLLVEDVVYTLAPLDLPGFTWLENRPDGGRLSVAQRFALEGIAEIQSVAIEGFVEYTFRYPVAPDAYQSVDVRAPFEVTVATFAAPLEPLVYAVSGHVTDAGNAILPGLRVTVEDAQGMALWETVTDSFGAYAFLRMPEGAALGFHPEEGYGVLVKENGAQILPLETVRGRVELHGDLTGMPVSLSMGGLPAVSPDVNGGFSFTDVGLSDQLLVAETPGGVLWRVETTDGETVVHLYPAASLSCRVHTPEGLPVPGAKVSLAGSGELRSETVGEDGSYDFDNLFPGNYTLTFAAPGGFILLEESQARLDIAPGEAYMANASMMEPATISGTLLDGAFPLEGVSIILSPSDAVATTDAEGRFAFTHLPVGTYTLSVNLPEGFILSQAVAPVILSRSGERAMLLLDAIRPVTFTGRVWNDLDDDGMLGMNEPGLADATVTLLGADSAEIASVRTGASGIYTFADLLPGTYYIRVTLPEGLIFAKKALEASRLLDGIDHWEGTSGPISVASGDEPGIFLCGATLSYGVRGAIQAAGAGLPGVSVTLLRGGMVVGEIITDEMGTYVFPSLRTGDYSLSMTLPEGYLFLDQPDAQTAHWPLSLRHGRVDAEINARAEQVGSLAAFAWLDMDADGVFWNEQGLSGVTVALYNASGRRVAESMTDAEGRCVLANLRPGEYQLRYQAPDKDFGFSAGTKQADAGWGYGKTIHISSGTVAQAEVGLSRLGTISGIVFADADYDGLRGENDFALPALVQLIDPATQIILRQTETGVDGTYAFTGLFTGRYVLRFTLAEGYQFTQNRDDTPTYNSDVPETTSNIAETGTLYLPMGEDLLVDAGAYKAGSIAGNAWHDGYNTGAFVEGNSPLAGISIMLLRGNETYRETITDEMGRYAFDGLPPGTYTLRAALPDTMRFSRQGEGSRISAILPTEDTTGDTGPWTLSMGRRIAPIDIGAVFLGSIDGTVRSALDQSPLGEAAVTIFRDGEVLLETTTDAAGTYHGDGLRPGQIKIHVTPPEGYILPEGPEEGSSTLIPQGGEALQEAISLLPEACVQGYLRLDEKTPVTGASVTLLRHTGEEKFTVQTLPLDANGFFRFGSLVPGTYSLHLSAPADIYFYNGNETEPTPLEMGKILDVDIAGYIGASVSGIVWEDNNNNGVYDKGEPLLSGVGVSVLDERRNVIAKTETNEVGAYLLDALPPLWGTLRFDLPKGYIFGLAAPEGAIQITMGMKQTNVSAGLLRNARIGDLVFLDVNGNGLQETSEPGVAGIKITLWRTAPDGTNPMALDETQTDANGFYRFDAVQAGTYYLTFDLGEYLPTRPVDMLPQINSKLPWTSDPSPATAFFPVHSGERLLIIDAGVVTVEMMEAFGWSADAYGRISEK